VTRVSGPIVAFFSRFSQTAIDLNVQRRNENVERITKTRRPMNRTADFGTERASHPKESSAASKERWRLEKSRGAKSLCTPQMPNGRKDIISKIQTLKEEIDRVKRWRIHQAENATTISIAAELNICG